MKILKASLFTVLTGSILMACSDPLPTDTQASKDEASPSTQTNEAIAQDTKPQKSLAEIEKAAQLRMNNFKLPEGFEISLWADETQTQNPSFFTFDSQGRMLMVETERFTRGVDDIRGHENKTVEDIYITSNADRLAMYEKYSDERPMSYYQTGDDLIRLLHDTDGDKRADKAQVFSDGYNGILDGIGAGVIERDGKVYYTNIPNLWMLEDTDNDGTADSKVSLQDGFGIRISFYGHDLHGLTWGPDGKLYWSIGDRGFNVKTKEGNHFYGPNLGGVFRSDPDGSNIEYFYTGLRNPQELAFDAYGNLFTADNDGDGGDTERVNYLIEGGDSGWHAGHQSIMSFTERLKLRSYEYTGDTKIPNAWMTQEMYVPRNDKQPAFMLPAIGKLNGGPSGLVYNPGTSFGKSLQDTFFVIHYLGSPAQSYISTFTVDEQGAGFVMDSNEMFLQGFNAVDLEFGPDGAMYISEYNYGGWQPEDQGTVYRLAHPEYQKTDTVAEVEKLLTSDFSTYTNTQLSDMMKHVNQRVRQRAQFELAKKGDEGFAIFKQFSQDETVGEIQRLHGVWGISQMAYYANNNQEMLSELSVLASDANPQVRIQATRALGDHKHTPSTKQLIGLINDEHPRVAMYAGIGLHRIANNGSNIDESAETVIAALAANGDTDLFLRHGLVMALSGMSKDTWWQYKDHDSEHVRMAVLLTARRALDEDIAYFLQDRSAHLVDEAITAINDMSIIGARDELAELLASRTGLPASSYPQDRVGQWEYHRVINANYAQGQNADALRLLNFAASDGLPIRLASEALSAIEAWDNVNPIDSTTGLPTNANQGTRDNITTMVQTMLPEVLAKVQGDALVQSIRLAQANNIDISSDVLMVAVNNQSNDAAVRLQALTYLMDRRLDGIEDVLSTLTSDKDVKVRGEALKHLFALNESLGFEKAQSFIASETIKDKQVAYKVLASSQADNIDQITLAKLEQLNTTKQANGATLELLALAQSRDNASVKAALAEYEQYKANADVMTQWAPSLHGGDALKGQQIFAGGGATECMRCHIVNWQGGAVGPELSNIGKERSREYLLQSIVDVQAAIAPGYGTMVINLKNGETISGIYQGETDDSIRLELQENEIKSYARADITDMQRPVSGMPPMNLLMDEYQVRDMVAYLVSLEREWEKVEEVH
jgi:putative membrane-bound dehydrogenase-like protein